MNYIHLGIIHYFGIKTRLDVIHPLAPLNPTKFNWGQSNINFQSKVMKAKGGLNDLWYPTMRKPPLAFITFD
jgi:hypothetical protein